MLNIRIRRNADDIDWGFDEMATTPIDNDFSPRV